MDRRHLELVDFCLALLPILLGLRLLTPLRRLGRLAPREFRKYKNVTFAVLALDVLTSTTLALWARLALFDILSGALALISALLLALLWFVARQSSTGGTERL